MKTDSINPVDLQRLKDLNNWLVNNKIDIEAVLNHCIEWYTIDPTFRTDIYKESI